LQKKVDLLGRFRYNAYTMRKQANRSTPRIKRRCVELYSANSPFKHKVVQSKKVFRRHPKHKKEVDL
jgi:hypothetical protein